MKMAAPNAVKTTALSSGEQGRGGCTCGQFLGGSSSSSPEQEQQQLTSNSSSSSRISSTTASRNDSTSCYLQSLDASFVQIPSSFQLPSAESNKQNLVGLSSSWKPALGSEFLLRLERLEQAATNPSNPPPLCRPCLQRVEQALDADTARLQSECHTYKEAVRDDKARVKGWMKSISRAHEQVAQQHGGGEVVAGSVGGEDDVNNNNNNNVDDDDIERTTLEAYRNEIEVLEAACQQHRDELAKLRAMQKEQALIGLDLDRMRDAMMEEQNDLQLEARAFDNNQEQLSRALAEIQHEAERLSSSEIRLPANLLHLQVDKERGLRYPLINNLRLAYRPKGDIQRNEIQAAWSLASHLLLIVGTLFEFRSQHWKIVPLSHCAKLIYYPQSRNNSGGDTTSPSAQPAAGGAKSRSVVFNLGHSHTHGSKALLTWNALLCQVVQHVTAKIREACDQGILDDVAVPALPFEISPTTIGSIALTQLQENNDAEWSRAIHYMASDLLWLSERASSFVLRQVLLASSLPDTSTVRSI